MSAPSPVYVVSTCRYTGRTSPYGFLRRVLHPTALIIHVATAIAIITLTAIQLIDQDTQDQHATCLATPTVSDMGYCSYLILAASLPLFFFAIAFLCCWPACPDTCTPLRVCRGVYGVLLTIWWAIAAGVMTTQVVDGALPPPWEGWEASRVAAVALLYVALVCSIVQMVAGPGMWAGCSKEAAEEEAAEAAAAIEDGGAPGGAMHHPIWMRMDNKTIFTVGMLGGAAS